MLKIKLRWWIGEDSLGIVALGIVRDVTQCYNLRENVPSCILIVCLVSV